MKSKKSAGSSARTAPPTCLLHDYLETACTCIKPVTDTQTLKIRLENYIALDRIGMDLFQRQSVRIQKCKELLEAL